MMVGDEQGAERTLFQGVDTHYLALSALDLMMEATTISSGSTSTEVLTHLTEITMRMKPSLLAPQSRRVAEVVLDAMDNKANNHREFSFEYFDAPSCSAKSALWLRGQWLPQEALGTEQLPLLKSIDLR